MTVFKQNPWLCRFAIAKERLDSSVGKVINRNAERFDSTSATSSLSAELKMTRYLENSYVVTESIYSIAREMISHFESLATERYINERKFISNCHLDEKRFFEEVGLDRDNRINPLCITGLSGEGKSKFAEFFYSLFINTSAKVYLSGGTFDNVEWDRFSATSKSTAASLVSGSILQDSQAGKFVYGKRAYTNGMIGFGLDEVQFTTSSSTANSSVTNLLLGLSKHCVPWFYICNYSLTWKLLRRNHEDIPRLLPRVFNFKTLNEYDDEEFIYEATKYVKILTSSISYLFDAHNSNARLIGELTGGIPYYITNLIAISYRLSYLSGEKAICESHIMKAYKSSQFALPKKFIEEIRKGNSWLIARKKLDLVYPPDLAASDEVSQLINSNSTDYQALIANLTKAERRILDVGTSVKIRAKIVTLSDVSREARLRQGFRYLDENVIE
jgi:hypothetical protein